MKIEIWGAAPKKEEKIRLRLVKRCGDIYLCAVDEDGEVLGAGHLLSFSATGEVRRCEFAAVPGLDIVEGKLVVR